MTRSRAKRPAGAERGGAMVEFALVAVVLFTIVFAIIQGAIIFGSWIIVTNAAREGARYASVCISRAELPASVVPVSGSRTCPGDWSATPNVSNTIRTYTEGMIAFPNPGDPAFNLNVSPSYDPKGTPGLRLVRVVIDYQVPLIAPIPNVLIPNPLPLTVESAMRIES